LKGLNNGINPSEQLRIANELRKLLKEEYHYYHLSKIKKYILKNRVYSNYVGYIDDALLHTVGVFSKRKAGSFLYDVESYATFHLLK
jgi:hypothetical protein